MTRKQAIEFITDSISGFFTYGIEGSDLGTPIERHQAFQDILSMDDESWADGVIYECDKRGVING